MPTSAITGLGQRRHRLTSSQDLPHRGDRRGAHHPGGRQCRRQHAWRKVPMRRAQLVWRHGVCPATSMVRHRHLFADRRIRSNGGFAINAATGVVKVADASKIDFESAASGHAYAITVRASDGTLSSSQNFTIAVSNVAPVAAADSASVNEDGVLTRTAAAAVLANDADINGGALTAVLVSGPAHGSLSLNASGSYIYTPAANYNGADSFTYKANDGTADSNVVTVALTVGSVNDAPAGANKDHHHPGRHALCLHGGRFRLQRSSADAGRIQRRQCPGGACGSGPCPAAGTLLTDNGVAVSLGQLVSVADITAGKLVFTPPAASTPMATTTPPSPSRCRTMAAPPMAASRWRFRPTPSRSTSRRSTTRRSPPPATRQRCTDSPRRRYLQLPAAHRAVQRRRWRHADPQHPESARRPRFRSRHAHHFGRALQHRDRHRQFHLDPPPIHRAPPPSAP